MPVPKWLRMVSDSVLDLSWSAGKIYVTEEKKSGYR
jgi:hypothetical protein